MNLNIGGDNNGRYKVKKRDRNPFCNGSFFYQQPDLSTLWRPEYAPGRNFLWKQLGGPRDSAL